MASKIINPRAALGGRHQIEVHELWKAVNKMTVPGSGLTSAAAMRVWAALWLFRDPATGVAHIERVDLADIARVSAARTSRILSSLELVGLIRREREPISGTQGPGKVVVFVL